MSTTHDAANIVEGEVEETGAMWDGEEVKATWVSGDTSRVYVKDGAILGLYKTTAPININVAYNGSNKDIPVEVIANPWATGTRFKIIEFSLGIDTFSTLEFMNNGVVVPNTSLVFNVEDPSVVVVDAEGNIAGLKVGKTLVTTFYNGKKYGATIEIG